MSSSSLSSSSKTVLSFPLFSVIVLFGPTQSGKSYFAQHLKEQLLSHLKEEDVDFPVVQLLSSDDIRRNILGGVKETTNISKYSRLMLEVSEQAFTILENTLVQYMKFPSRSHFIIIDSTALSLSNHENFKKLAQQYHFHLFGVGFKFKDIKEYLSHLQVASCNDISQTALKSLASSQFSRMTELLPSVTKVYATGKDERNLYCIKKWRQNYTDEVQILALGIPFLNRCRLDPLKKYLIIGDVHECIDDVKSLAVQAGFVVDHEGLLRFDPPRTEYMDLVFVGDLIDKGQRPQETIDFFYRSIRASRLYPECHPRFHMVSGNHDFKLKRFIEDYDNVMKNTRQSMSEADIHEFFSSYFLIQKLQESERLETLAKFDVVYQEMRPFLEFRSISADSRSFYVTHSPCAPKYLGKLSSESVRKQRHWVNTAQKPNECLDQADQQALGQTQTQTQDSQDSTFWNMLFDSVKDSNSASTFNYPWHVTGHLALQSHWNGVIQDSSAQKSFIYHGQQHWLMIDTGCASGNYLTGIVLGHGIHSSFQLKNTKAERNHVVVYKSHTPSSVNHSKLYPLPSSKSLGLVNVRALFNDYKTTPKDWVSFNSSFSAQTAAHQKVVVEEEKVVVSQSVTKTPNAAHVYAIDIDAQCRASVQTAKGRLTLGARECV